MSWLWWFFTYSRLPWIHVKSQLFWIFTWFWYFSLFGAGSLYQLSSFISISWTSFTVIVERWPYEIETNDQLKQWELYVLEDSLLDTVILVYDVHWDSLEPYTSRIQFLSDLVPINHYYSINTTATTKQTWLSYSVTNSGQNYISKCMINLPISFQPGTWSPSLSLSAIWFIQ